MGKYAFLLVFVMVAILACSPVNAVNELPAVGSAAPAFTLTNNEGKQVSLSDFKGKWVVLYFYPKDFTQGCTIEARNFQRDLAKYEAAKAVILGVSVDSAEGQSNGSSLRSTLSPNGRYVAFESQASDLVSPAVCEAI